MPDIDTARHTKQKIIDLARDRLDIDEDAVEPFGHYQAKLNYIEGLSTRREGKLIPCLATNLKDLKTRLGTIVVGYNHDGDAIHARDLIGNGAMTALNAVPMIAYRLRIPIFQSASTAMPLTGCHYGEVYALGSA